MFKHKLKKHNKNPALHKCTRLVNTPWDRIVTILVARMRIDPNTWLGETVWNQEILHEERYLIKRVNNGIHCNVS